MILLLYIAMWWISFGVMLYGVYLYLNVGHVQGIIYMVIGLFIAILRGYMRSECVRAERELEIQRAIEVDQRLDDARRARG